MKEQNNYLYDFESFRLDTLRRKLLHNGQDLQLKPKAFDTLLFLVQRAGEIVSKDELLGAVWSDTTVEENNLTQQISALRKKFSEHGGQDKFIVTLPKQGYKFAQPVREIIEQRESAVPAAVTEIYSLAEIPAAAVERDFKARRRLSLLETVIKFLFYSAMREITLGCLLMMMVVLFSFYVEAHKYNLRLPPVARSIAVLDFEPLDDKDTSNFYSAGITHTLTAKIGNLESMVLRPAGSSGRFYGQERDVIAIGNKLDADIVLEGSVQNEGDLVRIAVVAWDLKKRRQLWGDVFTRDAAHAFDIQDEISGEIISAVQAKVLN